MGTINRKRKIIMIVVASIIVLMMVGLAVFSAMRKQKKTYIVTQGSGWVMKWYPNREKIDKVKNKENEVYDILMELKKQEKTIYCYTVKAQSLPKKDETKESPIIHPYYAPHSYFLLEPAKNSNAKSNYFEIIEYPHNSKKNTLIWYYYIETDSE